MRVALVCILFLERNFLRVIQFHKTIAFKVDFMSDLVKAMQTMETE